MAGTGGRGICRRPLPTRIVFFERVPIHEATQSSRAVRSCALNDPHILVACPHCGTLNRLPRSRLGEAPGCGRCHQPVFVGQPVALDAANFDQHAVRSELPLLVDFWAPWCGPCRTMAPQFEMAARTLEPQVRLAKVDTEAEPALGARFGIRSIPTLVLMHAGREIARQAGATGADQIVQWTRAQVPGR